MQTITTKFIGPSNTRGARVKATTASGKSLTVPYDHAIGDESHSVAALTLARKLGWSGSLVGGDTRVGKVFVFSTGDVHQI